MKRTAPEPPQDTTKAKRRRCLTAPTVDQRIDKLETWLKYTHFHQTAQRHRLQERVYELEDMVLKLLYWRETLDPSVADAVDYENLLRDEPERQRHPVSSSEEGETSDSESE